MAERLKWAEVKELYPDEWVLMVDLTDDPVDDSPIGVVYWHSKSRAEVEQQDMALQGREKLLAWTGESRWYGIRIELFDENGKLPSKP